MSWLYLTLAILSEVFATTMMKLSAGFSNHIPAILMVFGYIVSFAFLTIALKEIEMSIAYAMWGAIGIVLISIIGMLFFNEQVSITRFIFIALIIVGVVGLRLTTNYGD